MKTFSRRRAIIIGVAITLLLALGYGLFRTPAEWQVPLRLLLPVVVGLLALIAGRVVTMGSAVLAAALLIPGLARAMEAGATADVAQNGIIAILCLLAG